VTAVLLKQILNSSGEAVATVGLLKSCRRWLLVFLNLGGIKAIGGLFVEEKTYDFLAFPHIGRSYSRQKLRLGWRRSGRLEKQSTKSYIKLADGPMVNYE
jgi:hypothetical protein